MRTFVIFFLSLFVGCVHASIPEPTPPVCKAFVANAHSVATSNGYVLIDVQFYPLPPLKQVTQIAVYLNKDHDRGLIYFLVPKDLASLSDKLFEGHFVSQGTCIGDDGLYLIFRRAVSQKSEGT